MTSGVWKMVVGRHSQPVITSSHTRSPTQVGDGMCRLEDSYKISLAIGKLCLMLVHSVVHDYLVQTAQAYEGRHYPPKLDFFSKQKDFL